MQGDPQRQYAQLLTPAAKSQKLLLRLQHKRLLPPEQLQRMQSAFTLWQKLLAKNIPATLWPDFADLVIFPEDEYLAVLLWPFSNRPTVQAAIGWRHLDGLLLVDQRDSAAWLSQQDSRLIIPLQLADRIGQAAWIAASRELSPWQARLVDCLAVVDADAALDLLGLLRRQATAPWPSEPAEPELQAAVPRVWFALWRARGQSVSLSKLQQSADQAQPAIDWLEQAGRVAAEAGGFRLR